MLTVKRKADRDQMAALLIEAMLRAGAQAVRVNEFLPREINVRVDAPGGAHITVDFDGNSSQPDTYVVTWNTSAAVFFNPAIGYVNPHHFGKASRVCEGFDALITTLTADVERFANGSGYMPHSDARLHAMRERYETNHWKWPPGGTR